MKDLIFTVNGHKVGNCGAQRQWVTINYLRDPVRDSNPKHFGATAVALARSEATALTAMSKMQ